MTAHINYNICADTHSPNTHSTKNQNQTPYDKISKVVPVKTNPASKATTANPALLECQLEKVSPTKVTTSDSGGDSRNHPKQNNVTEQQTSHPAPAKKRTTKPGTNPPVQGPDEYIELNRDEIYRLACTLKTDINPTTQLADFSGVHRVTQMLRWPCSLVLSPDRLLYHKDGTEGGPRNLIEVQAAVAGNQILFSSNRYQETIEEKLFRGLEKARWHEDKNAGSALKPDLWLRKSHSSCWVESTHLERHQYNVANIIYNDEAFEAFVKLALMEIDECDLPPRLVQHGFSNEEVKKQTEEQMRTIRNTLNSKDKSHIKAVKTTNTSAMDSHAEINLVNYIAEQELFPKQKSGSPKKLLMVAGTRANCYVCGANFAMLRSMQDKAVAPHGHGDHDHDAHEVDASQSKLDPFGYVLVGPPPYSQEIGIPYTGKQQMLGPNVFNPADEKEGLETLNLLKRGIKNYDQAVLNPLVGQLHATGSDHWWAGAAFHPASSRDLHTKVTFLRKGRDESSDDFYWFDENAAPTKELGQWRKHDPMFSAAIEQYLASFLLKEPELGQEESEEYPLCDLDQKLANNLDPAVKHSIVIDRDRHGIVAVWHKQMKDGRAAYREIRQGTPRPPIDADAQKQTPDPKRAPFSIIAQLNADDAAHGDVSPSVFSLALPVKKQVGFKDFVKAVEKAYGKDVSQEVALQLEDNGFQDNEFACELNNPNDSFPMELVSQHTGGRFVDVAERIAAALLALPVKKQVGFKDFVKAVEKAYGQNVKQTVAVQLEDNGFDGNEFAWELNNPNDSIPVELVSQHPDVNGRFVVVAEQIAAALLDYEERVAQPVNPNDML